MSAQTVRLRAVSHLYPPTTHSAKRKSSRLRRFILLLPPFLVLIALLWSRPSHGQQPYMHSETTSRILTTKSRRLPTPSECHLWKSVARDLSKLHLYRRHFASHDLTDWFIYVTFFHEAWQQNLHHTPTYIDIAANHAKKWSATYFLDRCMNWNGVCVEANPKYWSELKSKRTCKLVKDCVSDRVRAVNFSLTDAYGGVVSQSKGGGVNITLHQSDKFRNIYSGVKQMMCQPVHAVIPSGYYDFLSLDVEGHELNVLRGIDWNSMTFGVIITENRSFQVQKLLSGLGYTRISGVLGDDIWIGPGEHFRVNAGIRRLLKTFNRTSYQFQDRSIDFLE